MAYFRPSIDSEGIHIPTYDDILNHLIDQYKAVFGDDVYVGIDSKDYQMLSIFARAMDDFSALAVDAYASRSPLYATGDSLDVLCSVVGITRKSAEKAVATLQLTGVENTVIPAGSKVVDFDGGLWSTNASATIASGVATVTATKDEAGEYNLTAGSIATIYTPVVGWTGVSNTTVGVVGEDTETDEALRTRMRQQLITKATFNEVSIESAVRNVEDVENAVVCVNNGGSTDDRGIPAHSICAVVDGGESQAVADAIFATKAPGVGTYGSTSATVVDAYGNSNTISFSRPTTDRVVIVLSGNVYDARTDLAALKDSIKEAIMEYVNALGIGDSLTVNRLYGVIYSLDTVTGLSMEDLYARINGTEERTTYTPNWDELLRIQSENDIDVSGIVYYQE